MTDHPISTDTKREWHIIEQGQPVGPLPESEVISRIQRGRLLTGTLVWRPGLENWTPLEETELASFAETAGVSTSGMVPCDQCNTITPIDDTVSILGLRYCPTCKTIQAQCLKEGAPPPGSLPLAGFWIRFVALVLDGAFVGVINVLGEAIVLRLLMMLGAEEIGLHLVSMILTVPQLLSAMLYSTWFVGRYGATPGKMAFGLRIVRPDGTSVTYLRALARYFAEILSGVILYIGYLMAATDEERRTLHDRLCDTRVIRE